MIPDPDVVSGLLRRAAEESILPRFQRLARHDVREKAPGDLVTIADTDAERLLTPLLRDLLPGSLVVGEEAAAADVEVLNHLLGERHVWLIDPVDGTVNFANGNPNFAVIVALVEAGQVCAGWIHRPVENTTIYATTGGGAWRGGRRLSLGEPPPLERMVGMVAGTLPGRGRARKIIDASGAVGATVNIRCSGCTYVQLAEGRYHFAVFGRAKPWDHAAGWLIHREAGGYGAFLDGIPYTPLRHDHPLLYAPSRASWQALQRILAPPA